jgi:curved DNA-binding protein CbpA
MKKTLGIVLCWMSLLGYAQSYEMEGNLILIEGDSIPNASVQLDEVVLFPPLQFAFYDSAKQYAILRARTLKVYPYAKLAADRLQILNERLNTLKKKRQRLKYLKRLESFIYGEFEQELKKLSRSQGRILIKLVHRQTGFTTHELVKELRNGWRAFIYQTTASMFKLTLKQEYDPEENKEDYYIEDILQRAFADGLLERQETALDYSLDSLYMIWKDDSPKRFFLKPNN